MRRLNHAMTVAPQLQHRRITVALSRDPYDVVIGQGSLANIGLALVEAGIRRDAKSWW